VSARCRTRPLQHSPSAPTESTRVRIRRRRSGQHPPSPG
jgi:hypothetical protein